MSGDHSHNIDTHTPRGKQQKRALKAVSALKGIMFVAEAVTGYFAHSTAMIGDCANMLEDTLSAAASVVVHSRSPRAQAAVAIVKASIMSVLGLGVLGGAVFMLLNPAALPVAATMGIFGGLGLAVNAVCGGLLFRFRNDNINMKAAWKCLRNDMASNAGVLLAAGLSHFLTSAIPDLVIGAAVATLCVKSAIDIFREAIPMLRKKTPASADKTAQPKPQPSPQPSPKAASAFKKALRSVFSKSAPKTAAANIPVPAPVRQTPAPAQTQ